MTGALRFAVVALLILAGAGCAPDVYYRTEASGGALTRTAAEQHLANYARTATTPLVPDRLDAPLEAIVIRLPDYPEELRRANVEGTVVIAFTVRADGSVGELTIRQSQNRSLNPLALEAVRRWRFKPPLLKGAPTTLRVELPLEFKLF